MNHKVCNYQFVSIWAFEFSDSIIFNIICNLPEKVSHIFSISKTQAYDLVKAISQSCCSKYPNKHDSVNLLARSLKYQKKSHISSSFREPISDLSDDDLVGPKKWNHLATKWDKYEPIICFPPYFTALWQLALIDFCFKLDNLFSLGLGGRLDSRRFSLEDCSRQILVLINFLIETIAFDALCVRRFERLVRISLGTRFDAATAVVVTLVRRQELRVAGQRFED